MAALETCCTQHGDADLVLLDLKMPGSRGFSSLLYLRQQHPELPVIVVSATEDSQVIAKARDFGAVGYITKSSSVGSIEDAIEAVLAGETHFPECLGSAAEGSEMAARLASLTAQQIKVLTTLSDGKLNKQMAFELGVSEATIKAHMTAIMRKLGCNSRTQAALIAQQLDVDDTLMRAHE